MTTTEQPISSEDAADLELLNKLCLPEIFRRQLSRVVRPERPECAAYLKTPPSPAWIRALRVLQAGIHREGKSVGPFCKEFFTGFCESYDERTALRAVAAILYDQECRGVRSSEALTTTLGPPPYYTIFCKMVFGISPLIEHMLCVDYGIGVFPVRGRLFCPDWVHRRYVWPGIDNFCKYLTDFVDCCRNGQLPKKTAWMNLGAHLDILDPAGCGTGDISDIAIMLYQYHTHHRQLSLEDYEKGVTGYTGIMQELQNEISTRGPDRLLRKLTVDSGYLVSYFVKDSEKRKMMLPIVKSIAAQHSLHIPIISLTDNFRKFPLPDQVIWKSQTNEDAPPPYSRLPPVQPTVTVTGEDIALTKKA